MNDNPDTSNNNRQILSILSHGSILFGSTVVTIGVPIAILLLSQDSIVQNNAKEALNFYITCYVLAIVFALLIFLLIGIPLLILLFIASWVMPIIAIVRVLKNPDRSYRYPLIFHLL